ncbi:putative peptidase A22B, signal peptide peptidase [Helianthus annuus]|nr:putative peptidase A22B, signal peptide peptidase [Helianthus annuus]
MCILVVCLEAEAAIELDKLLKDASNEYMSTEVSYFSGVFEITNTSVIVFIVVSSCFLVWLYKNMSYVFIEVLVVLFAIGGGEHGIYVIHISGGLEYNLSIASSRNFNKCSFRSFENVAKSFIKIPFLGGGVALIITVIQIIQVPNLKLQIQ